MDDNPHEIRRIFPITFSIAVDMSRLVGRDVAGRVGNTGALYLIDDECEVTSARRSNN